MYSDMPKVLHKVIGIPMIEHVISKAYSLKPKSITVLINKKLLFLKKIFKLKFLVQEPQLGTGHAVKIFQKQNKNRSASY